MPYIISIHGRSAKLFLTKISYFKRKKRVYLDTISSSSANSDLDFFSHFFSGHHLSSFHGPPSELDWYWVSFYLVFFCNESLLTRVCSHFGPLAGRVFRNPRVCFAAFVLPRRRPCFYWLFYDDDYFWNGPTPKPLAPAEVPRHFFFFCSSTHSPRTPTWKLHRILWKTLAVGQNREKKLGKTQ